MTLRPVEFHVLLALAADDLHGYAILQEVARLTDGDLEIEPGTLYRALHRMLKDGWVVESLRRPAADVDDERRRYLSADAARAPGCGDGGGPPLAPAVSCASAQTGVPCLTRAAHHRPRRMWRANRAARKPIDGSPGGSCGCIRLGFVVLSVSGSRMRSTTACARVEPPAPRPRRFVRAPCSTRFAMLQGSGSTSLG